MAKNVSRKEQLIPLEALIEEFLIDSQAAELSPRTIEYYRSRLKLWMRFNRQEGIETFSDFDYRAINRYLIWLKETNHTDGGKHCAWRAVSVFINWFFKTYKPRGMENPLDTAAKPKKPRDIIPPVTIETVKKLLEDCKKETYIGDRDRAMMFILFDTGVRAAELLSIKIGDVDFQRNSIFIRLGKGKKPRTVFMSVKTKRILRTFVTRWRMEDDDDKPLWAKENGDPLSYEGLQDMLQHRSQRAGVPRPTPHSFRRAFAITSLRKGCDIYSLQRMMGHADLQVLRTYLDQNDDDIREAHLRASPGEEL